MRGLEITQSRPLGSFDTSLFLDAADVNEERFGNEVVECCSNLVTGPLPRVISKHRADSTHSIVGAASIIAKSVRDRIMDTISAELGFDMGSGYPSDPKTTDFIRDYVSTRGELPPHCRRTWETIKRIQRAQEQSKLTSFL
jgi:ribonuclease HII